MLPQLAVHLGREIHPLDPQPHRHSMLVPRVCAPRLRSVAWGSIGHMIFFSRQQAANPGGTQVIYDSYSGRQQNLMMHAQCPLPVYYSQTRGAFNQKIAITPSSNFFPNLLPARALIRKNTVFTVTVTVNIAAV